MREPPRLVLQPVVARPLSAARERVEGGEDVQGHQHRARLENLAVIDVASGGQVVLQAPGQPDAVVVVRVARPARPCATDDRLPQARHALRKAIEGRAEADVVHEGQRALHAADSQARRAAKASVAPRLEIAAQRRRGARIAAWHAGSATSWSAPTDRSTRESRPRSRAGCAGTTTDRRRSIRGRAVRCGSCGPNRGPIARPRRDGNGR
jgi:hypothetical protein